MIAEYLFGTGRLIINDLVESRTIGSLMCSTSNIYSSNSMQRVISKPCTRRSSAFNSRQYRTQPILTCCSHSKDTIDMGIIKRTSVFYPRSGSHSIALLLFFSGRFHDSTTPQHNIPEGLDRVSGSDKPIIMGSQCIWARLLVHIYGVCMRAMQTVK